MPWTLESRTAGRGNYVLENPTSSLASQAGSSRCHTGGGGQAKLRIVVKLCLDHCKLSLCTLLATFFGKSYSMQRRKKASRATSVLATHAAREATNRAGSHGFKLDN